MPDIRTRKSLEKTQIKFFLWNRKKSSDEN